MRSNQPVNNPIDQKTTQSTKSQKRAWLWDALIIAILVIGAFLRFTGVNWDTDYHLHPDERFLTMVESAITPVDNLSHYFNTSVSSLNPNNKGYTFYVYGTLPIFLVRYVGELVGHTGYGDIHLVGRVLSGVFDLGTIFFVFLIGRKLYKNTKLGLFAALFSAMSVLQIQLSHYFTVDNVANFFAYAAIYTAVCIMMAETSPMVIKEGEPRWRQLLTQGHHIGKYAVFGVLFGMALASKVSIYALAFLLPIAAGIYYSKMDKEKRDVEIGFIFRNLILAGVLAFIAFRVFQPYAFMGPGFFGIKINPGWISSLKELSIISKGDVDVPYALQWASRPLSFAPSNLIQWGLGLSLGLLGIFGFLWMAWRIIKGDWHKHLLIWGWAAFVLVSQSLAWVRSMRYLLPIYPALCLIAAWAIFKLWENGAGTVKKVTKINLNWRRILAATAATVTLVGTAVWATAFTSIYTRPVTRVAASEWIYDNIASAIELPISLSNDEMVMQRLSYQNTVLISLSQPYTYGFSVESDHKLSKLTLEHVLFSLMNNPGMSANPESITMLAKVWAGDKAEGNLLASALLQSNFLQISDPRGESAGLVFDQPLQLKAGKRYTVEISVIEMNINLKLDGGAWLTFEDEGQQIRQYLPPPAYRVTASTPYQFPFYPQVSGTISTIRLNRVVDLLKLDQDATLGVSISNPGQSEEPIASGQISKNFSAVLDPRGEEALIYFDQPVQLDSSIMYTIAFTVVDGASELAFYNQAPAIETTWDDALPLSMFGYNLFGYETGIYGNVRNMELYYDDTQTKKDLIYTTLDQTDAIFISSNRQWGTITRVPQRYPFTTEYYRALIGCPVDKDLLWCYQVAEPGMFNGELGFELTAVFQSDPTFLGLTINDQAAEEAFTVYDHPKVLIFEKTDAYDPSKVRQLLDKVDISAAIRMTPGQASRFNGNLKLTENERQLQQSGGTFNELFPADSALNTQPWLAAVIWYLAIGLLGLIAYPIVRVVFHGLPDKGYPFSRLAGMILMAFFTWLAGSTWFTFSKLTIGMVLLLLLAASSFLAFRQRSELLEEIKTRKKYFITVEGLVLVLFLISLGIRYGNPDLWHPWKGGEKPMDLSYFTAVLKSTVFPPYDPWYAGGYINYYYFGFVLVGVPTKLLGIMPAIAYNLILPTLFALTGIGAFSVGWNLFARKRKSTDEEEVSIKANTLRATFAGIVSVFTVLVMGNLGTLRMLWQGLQRLVAPGGIIDGASFGDRFIWFFQGLGKFIGGAKLPYAIGDWYWIPSRALPGEAITEFPFFTFTYADLHAHMIDLSITLLVIGWGLGLLLGRWNWRQEKRLKPWFLFAATSLFGGMAIGIMRATNTWDFPTYLLLSCLVVLYTVIRYAEVPTWLLTGRANWLRKSVYCAGILALLVGSAMLCGLPFTSKYGQSYGSIQLWTGDHSPMASYLVHWGVQLFVIITWFVWETREWLASTPLSSLKKLRPYAGYLQALAVLFGLLLVLITILGVKIGWLAGILGGWALVLMLRPGQSDSKRLVFFMTGTALFLTLFVEMFVLVGDIGRMNTVFKFYYQAWTFFGLSAAAALVWLIPAVSTRWKSSVSAIWQVVLALLLFGAALYPITAATDKVRDRMSAETPATLDGLEFMATSDYYDQDAILDLDRDYKAILWMQQNVKGSPVIVEANTVEYRWGNRFTIYTGLPGILGWNWHQRQQRGYIDSNEIAVRLERISSFYQTTDLQTALDFLSDYHVKYIILGQMEQAYFQGDGLNKFDQYNGKYWKEVFSEQETVIYEVIDGD